METQKTTKYRRPTKRYQLDKLRPIGEYFYYAFNLRPQGDHRPDNVKFPEVRSTPPRHSAC